MIIFKLPIPTYIYSVLILSILLITVSVSPVYSQEYKHEYFNKSEGLPDNYVYDFDIDKDNNIWLSTRAGISVYDGFNFKPIKDLQNAINFRSIRFDNQGRLWLIKDIHEYSVDITEKIIIFDPRSKSISKITEIFPEAKTLLTQNTNYTLKTDNQNNLSIVGKKMVPVIYFEKNKLIAYKTKYQDTRLTLNVEEPFTIMSINKASDTTVFENIKTGRIRKYATPNMLYSVEKDDELIIKGSKNDFNNLGINNSIITAEGLDTLFIQGYPNFKHISMGDNIIIGYLDRIIIYNYKKKTYTSLTEQLGQYLKNSTILRIKEQNGIVWVATSNGLFKISPKNKLFYTILDGQQLSIRNLVHWKNQEIIACTERGIFKVDLASGTKDIILKDVQAYTLTSMDSLNFIVGSHNTISQKWNILEDTIKKSRPKFNYLLGSPTGAHIFYHKDTSSTYWLVSNYGFSKYFPETDSIVLLQKKLNIDNVINSIYPNPLDSSKLFLPYTHGIYEFDINSEEITDIEALQNVIPSYIKKDNKQDGLLWIGTKYKGLVKWTYGDTKIEKQYTIENGLKSNNVHSILFDNQGDIWMSTDNGISILDAQTDKINTLTTTHGLHDNEFNKHSSLALDDSLFIFGGVDGLVYFDPNKANEKPTQKPTNIIGYSYLDNRTGETIIRDLNHEKNRNIVILSNQLNYKLLISKPSPPLPQTLKYLIAGISDDWQYSQNNAIPIDNLEQGNNKLLISRQLGVNKWSPTHTVSLFSPTPWYMNYWLYGFIFLMGLLVIIAYLNSVKIKTQKLNQRIIEEVALKTTELRIKNEKLEKSQNLNSRLFTIIGHDLRSPLISLGNIGKSLTYLTKKGDTQNIERLTTTIEHNAKNSLKIIDSLLEWTHLKRTESLNLTKVNLNDVVISAINDKKNDALNKNITILRELTTNSNFITDTESVQIIIRNLISNAIKFSNPNDSVLVKTTNDEIRFVISVEDNGIGISDNLIYKLKNKNKVKSTAGTNFEQGLGMGLSISSDLANNINARITFTPKDIGTIVSLSIAHPQNLTEV